MEDELFERMKRANDNLLRIEGHRQVIEELEGELNRPGIDFDERNDILQEIDRYNSDIEQWQNEINPDLEFINGYNTIIAGIKDHEQLIEDLTNESMEPGVDQFTKNENYSEIERYEEDIRNWRSILSTNYKGTGLKEIDFREKSTQEIEEAIQSKINNINKTIAFYNANIENRQNELVNDSDDSLENAHEIESMQRELHQIEGELEEYTALRHSFEIFNKLGITKTPNMKNITRNNTTRTTGTDTTRTTGTDTTRTTGTDTTRTTGTDTTRTTGTDTTRTTGTDTTRTTDPNAPVPPVRAGVILKDSPNVTIAVPEEKKILIKYLAQTGKYTIAGLDDKTRTIDAEGLQGKKRLKADEKLKFVESKISKEDYDRIIGGLSKKVLKSFDPNLVTILYEQFGKGKEGVTVVRDYFLVLDGTKKKEDLPYEMTYDLNGIDKVAELNTVTDKDGNDKIVKGKKLNLFDRTRLRNMAIANEPAAKVIVPQKTKWWKKALIGLISGITAIGAAVTVKQLAEKNEEKNLEKVMDTIDSEKTLNDKTIPDGQVSSTQYIVQGGLKPDAQPTPFVSRNEFRDIMKVEFELRDKTENLENLKLGSVLKDLPKGLEYREGMDGGRTGNIGQDENTPTDGFYVIDRSVEIQPDSIKTEYGLNGNDLNKNANLVHISFVAGAKTYEEALKIVEENKANENYEKIKDKIQPRGWVNAETIAKAYENQQKQSTHKAKDSNDREL